MLYLVSMRKAPVWVVAVAFTFITTNSYASAGYYPIHRGDLLGVEACLPIRTTSPLILQIESMDLHWKKVAVVPFNKLTRQDCDRGSLKLVYRWKVNVSLGGTLRLWDSTLKRSYFVWPDGIRIQG